MKNRQLKNMMLSAMCLAIGLVLPFLTGQLQQIGNMLLPMHIPVFICGLICSPGYGMAVGFILPLLRSVLFQMPVLYPNALGMAFELATYGFVAGLLYSRSKYKCTKSLFKAMLAAMISGRVVWGVARAVMLGVADTPFSVSMFVSGAFLNAVPGIILQLILVPAIMVALGKAKLVPLIKIKSKDKIR